MTLSLKLGFDPLPRRVILLGSEKLSVYHWIKGYVANSYLFDAKGDGQHQFERYLQDVPDQPVSILVDLAEEEFRQEIIPHVFGSDRQAIIKRKQERLFRDTTYCYSCIQSREPEGRRDDRILLTSITKPSLLDPWMTLLEKYHVPVTSVTSIAIFFQEILDLIPESTNNMLVVSLQSISGLRQSFFAEGKLKISRSIKMPRLGTVPYAPLIKEEVERINRYLSNYFVTAGEPIDVYLLSHGKILADMRRELEETETDKYHLLDIQDLAIAASYNLEIKTPFCDPLLVQKAFDKQPDNHYANSKNTRYFTMRKIRHALYVSSLLVLLSSTLYSGINLLKAVSQKQESIAMAKKTAFYNERYRLASAKLPEVPVEPDDLQTLVDLAENLKKYKTKPVPIWQVISASLDQHPSIILNELKWRQSREPDYKPSELKIDETARVSPSTLPGEKLGESQNYLYYQIVNLDAQLSGFDGDYRKTIDTINSFVETLQQHHGVVSATVESFPLNISSDAILQGTTNAINKEALFSIKVAIGIKN